MNDLRGIADAEGQHDDRRQRDAGDRIHRRDERLEDRAEPVRTAEHEARGKAAADAGDETEERVLQGDGGRDPEIVLGSRHAAGEFAIEPAVEHAELGLEAAQDQEVLEDVGRLGHEIGVEQIRHQPGKAAVQIVPPLPDRQEADADQHLPCERSAGAARAPHGLRPLMNSSPSECQIS
ncbi:hypothetical protein ACVWXN_008358 [Bradyrhizobium sp. i1.4.4]